MIRERALEYVLAPAQNSSLLPDVLPLILGAVVIELYFGKHTDEVMGWNTSVGNAIIWISTGLSLAITGVLDTAVERAVTYLILLSGSLTAYMDFFHKWSAAAAFHASSPELIYPLAYVTVVTVKTGIPITITTLKAAAVFVLGVTAMFGLIKFLIPPADDGIGSVSFD